MDAPASTEPSPTGLAHVATVSFLAARAAPSAQFWLALAGGIALARTSVLNGLRMGYGVEPRVDAPDRSPSWGPRASTGRSPRR